MVDTEKSIFGEFLKVQRLKKGWSLSELEKKTGIDKSYLHRLEKGVRRNPTVSIIHLLSKAFGVEIVSLVELVLLEQDDKAQ